MLVKQQAWSGLLIAMILSVSLLSCSSSTSVDDVAEDDGIAPSGILDLAVAAFTNESVTLAWTAPGDDSTSGTATAYDVRYSFQDDLWSDWDSAEVVPGAPAPQPAGSAESMIVSGLLEDSTYYFAVRTRDEESNWSFVSNVVSATCYNDFAVAIPDANLEAAIRVSIAKPTGDIYKSDLLGLESLEATGMGISDLSGLEYCTALHALIVRGNEIDDLSPLAGLSSLRSLDASDNNLSDVSPLSGLANLEQLNLSTNAIADIAALANLTGIEVLRLTENLVTDLSALEGMAGIEYLNLDWNLVTDIGPLAANSGLGDGDQVSLHVNPLSFESVNIHIPALQARGVLVYWDLDEVPPGPVSDLHVIAASATSVTLAWTAPGDDGIWGRADAYEVRYSPDSLEAVGWYGAQAAVGAPQPEEAGLAEDMEITGLETDTRYYFVLKTRDESDNWSGISNTAVGTPFIDVVVVIPDPGLEAALRDEIGLPTGDIHKTDLFGVLELQAVGRDISDLTGLEYCTNMTVLELQNNDLTEVGVLGNLIHLANLNLDMNAIADIDPLADLTGLVTLSLRDNQVSDIAALAGLGKLQYLFCSNNYISNIAPLSGLSSLTFLEAVNNNIADITPLSSLTALTYLFLSLNQVVDLSPLGGVMSLRYVYFDYNLVSDVTALSGLGGIERISVRFNQVTDIAPLVANTGLGTGDEVWLESNPLSTTSVDVHIPALVARGVTVHY